MRLLQMDGDPCITSIVVTLIEIKFVSFELKLTISFDGNRSKGIDTAKRKLEKLQFSTSLSFVKI